MRFPEDAFRKLSCMPVAPNMLFFCMPVPAGPISPADDFCGAVCGAVPPARFIGLANRDRGDSIKGRTIYKMAADGKVDQRIALLVPESGNPGCLEENRG